MALRRRAQNAQLLHLGRLGRHVRRERLAQLRHLHHGRLSRPDLHMAAKGEEGSQVLPPMPMIGMQHSPRPQSCSAPPPGHGLPPPAQGAWMARSAAAARRMPNWQRAWLCVADASATRTDSGAACQQDKKGVSSRHQDWGPRRQRRRACTHLPAVSLRHRCCPAAPRGLHVQRQPGPLGPEAVKPGGRVRKALREADHHTHVVAQRVALPSRRCRRRLRQLVDALATLRHRGRHLRVQRVAVGVGPAQGVTVVPPPGGNAAAEHGNSHGHGRCGPKEVRLRRQRHYAPAHLRLRHPGRCQRCASSEAGASASYRLPSTRAARTVSAPVRCAYDLAASRKASVRSQ